MTAVNLVRFSPGRLRITIINHARPTGRGVAYGSRRPEHLLNVAARNMSALRDCPDHLLQWLRTRSDFDAVPEIELRERFIPRMIYGDYLRSLMQHYLLGDGRVGEVVTDFREGEARDLELTGDEATIHFADGTRVEADRVVLALGNEVPAAPPGAESLAEHPAWVGNPWGGWEQRLPGDDGSIVVLGTGLTTVDAIITLRSLGWLGRIHAISRNGWFPHAHFRGIEYPGFPPPDIDLSKLGLDALVAVIGQHCAQLHERNANPAIIVDKMRPHTQRIWQSFTPDERRRFVRQHAARWNVMRHRIAPEIHAQITNAQLTGQLRVHAGGIERVEAAGPQQVKVHLSNGTSESGDLVINATGPQTRFTATQSPLLQNLLRRGLVSPDAMDMGVRVDPDHTVIAADGERSKVLLALGPLLRGTLWETIAVPELRGQAQRVAETLLDQTPVAEAEPAALEYMI
jgi:uncharacterized NAD(P)/FAD-binding protein YdhS